MAHPVVFPENTVLTPASYCQHLREQMTPDGFLDVEYWFIDDLDLWAEKITSDICLRCKVRAEEVDWNALTTELEGLIQNITTIASYYDHLKSVDNMADVKKVLLNDAQLIDCVKTYFVEQNYTDTPPFFYELCISARHYCELLTLSAPKTIIAGKMEQLAQTLLMYRYGETIEEVTLSQ